MTNDCQQLAVCVQGGWKSYGNCFKSTIVLHDIKLHVPKGIIYGLLGPSGCGKTTLLRCIIGRLEFDRGSVNVYGKRPGSRDHDIPGRSVGFMPQETALYKNFSISEMVHHFGRLHHMNSKDIKSRETFLISFLHLPSPTKNVSQLSGGQQRRVSLACALLQQPQLLILDEPTVGVDPLLREKIWIHLIEISQRTETTIIITTHYIEEARKANRVGLMRNGRMLAEEEPSLLINKFNQTSLENVFLQLCFQDENHIDQTINHNNNENLTTDLLNISNEETKLNYIEKSKRFLSDKLVYPRLHKISALIIKDLTIIKRSIGFLFFQFLIPVVQVSLFCLCIGRDPENLGLSLYNSEQINAFPSGNYSLQFLNKINHQQIYFTSYNDFDQAINGVKQGRYWGVLSIQSNFTQAVKNKLFAFDTDPSTLNASSIHLYLDMTNQQVSYLIENVILNSMELFLKDVLSSFKLDPSLINPPVIMEKAIYGNLNPNFLNFAAPGMMISIIFFLAIGLTALMFVIEKKEGLLERSWIAGVTTIEMILSHIIVKFFIQVIQVTFLIIFAHFIFKVEIKGSIILTMSLIFLQGICGMSYGLLISSLCEQEVEVMEVAMGSVFPLLLASGVIWPIEGMPKIMRLISSLTPLTHTVEAIRCICSRGWTLMDFKVWFGFAVASGWTLFFLIIATLLFALKK